MRPTFSIIAFTVLSGAGYGLLFLVGVLIAVGDSLAPYTGYWFDDFNFAHPPIQASTTHPAHYVGFALLIGATLASIGLLASVGHLGKPLRAWRALSQWRSSWLSREGVVAIATFVPIAVLLVLLLMQTTPTEWLLRSLGLLIAIGSAVTVYCTANIYSTLKPIAAWHNRFVVPLYLLLAVYSGALWLCALWMSTHVIPDAVWIVVANALLIAPGCALLKWLYWRDIDRHRSTPSTGDATGLARLGAVHSFEAPHTEENYLTHEMGFVLARKHSQRLRTIALVTIALAPIVAIPLSWLIGWSAAWLMVAVGMLGVFVERWLFFAEARHAVIAYYGR